MRKLLYSIIAIGGFSLYVLFQDKVGSAVVNTPLLPTSQAPTTPITSTGKYKDGDYTGISVDVYYGFVQVKAIINAGQITDIVFLSYPNERPNSVRINTQAIPILKSEAIRIQDFDVDTVSGASDSSQGFRNSLESALSQAKI